MSRLQKKHLGKPRLHKQSGAVLIVSLVMLTILTIIAVGTATDIGFQSNMARNNQISLHAFNVALSELRGQYQASKDNHQINGIPYQQLLANIRQSTNSYPVEDADILMASEDNDFVQTVAISFVREGVCGGGNQVGNTALIFEMNSTSSLENTGISSNQTLGICYPKPQ